MVHSDDDAHATEFCELYNEIQRRPDGEVVILRAICMLKILAEGPIEAGYAELEDEFPAELEI